MGRRSRIDKESKNPTLNDVAAKEETTLLVGFKELKNNLLGGKESLEELHALANTAGAIIKQELMLKINNRTLLFISEGKVELALIVQQEDIDLVIFLIIVPRQQHNLEDHLDCRVIDRAALILHIFAQRPKQGENLSSPVKIHFGLRGIGTNYPGRWYWNQGLMKQGWSQIVAISERIGELQNCR